MKQVIAYLVKPNSSRWEWIIKQKPVRLLLPTHWGKPYPPIDRYAALTTQEADAFPMKHVGLRDSLENNDFVSSAAWSYDIADETQHVRYGHRWIPVMIEKFSEVRSYDQVKADACNWRESVLGKAYMAQPKWLFTFPNLKCPDRARSIALKVRRIHEPRIAKMNLRF